MQQIASFLQCLCCGMSVDEKRRVECQRMLANILRYTSHTKLCDASHYVHHAVKEMFRTSTCQDIWTADVDGELAGVRKQYEDFITPVRLNRLLAHEETAVDRYIAQKAFERFEKQTNSVMLKCFHSAGFRKPFTMFIQGPIFFKRE